MRHLSLNYDLNDKKEPGLGRVGEEGILDGRETSLLALKVKQSWQIQGIGGMVSMARVKWEKDGKSGPRGRLRLS